MTLKIGDYVVQTEKKKSEGYCLDSLFEAAYFGDGFNLLKQQKEGIYVVTKISKFIGGRFEASLNGIIYPKLRVKDYQLATLEEKRKYELKKVFIK